MEELDIKTAFLLAEINDYIENISKVYQIPKDMVTAAVYMAAAVAAGNRITTFDLSRKSSRILTWTYPCLR